MSKTKKKVTPHKRWVVRLGVEEWSQYTYPRRPEDTLELLGSVRHGQEMGALGRDSSGEFFIVVGDHLTPIKKKHVMGVLGKRSAEMFIVTMPNEEPQPTVAPVRSAPSIPVVIKKRRRVVPEFAW